LRVGGEARAVGEGKAKSHLEGPMGLGRSKGWSGTNKCITDPQKKIGGWRVGIELPRFGWNLLRTRIRPEIGHHDVVHGGGKAVYRAGGLIAGEKKKKAPTN